MRQVLKPHHLGECGTKVQSAGMVRGRTSSPSASQMARGRRAPRDYSSRFTVQLCDWANQIIHRNQKSDDQHLTIDYDKKSFAAAAVGRH